MECRVRVDQTPPKLEINLDSLDTLSGGETKLNENQTINFSTMDDNPQFLKYCFRPIGSSECQSDDEFKLAQDYVSPPRQGRWEILYFATDKADNRSETETRRFAIYHNQSVELLRKDFSSSALKTIGGRSPEAFSDFQESMAAYEQLSLEDEKKELRWDILNAFWALDETLTHKKTIPLSKISKTFASQFTIKSLS